MSGTTVNVAKLPDCDIHTYELNKPGVPAKYDGKTKMGPWANMCKEHFESDGVGLGVGMGQMLVVRTESLEDALEDPTGLLPPS